PHFVDVDPRAASPRREALMLHPLVALEHQTRYIVAFQNIQAQAGGLVPVIKGFAEIRAGKGGKATADLRKHYADNIFPVLENAGVSRNALQLAWDFTAGTKEYAQADLRRVVQLTNEWLAN